MLPKYFAVSDGRHSVFVRDDDYVNLTHILRAAGKHRSEIMELKRKKAFHFETIRGDAKTQGTYIELSEAIKI